MAQHDIMHGSAAWERIQRGIPDDVAPRALRDILHGYNNILGPIVDSLNRVMDAQDASKADVGAALDRAARELDTAREHVRQEVAAAKSAADDEHVRIHLRIDRRGEDLDRLRDELVGPRNGLIVSMGRDLEAGTAKAKAELEARIGRMTAILLTVLGGIVVSSIMLAANLATKGAG